MGKSKLRRLLDIKEVYWAIDILVKTTVGFTVKVNPGEAEPPRFVAKTTNRDGNLVSATADSPVSAVIILFRTIYPELAMAFYKDPGTKEVGGTRDNVVS